MVKNVSSIPNLRGNTMLPLRPAASLATPLMIPPANAPPSTSFTVPPPLPPPRDGAISAQKLGEIENEIILADSRDGTQQPFGSEESAKELGMNSKRVLPLKLPGESSWEMKGVVSHYTRPDGTVACETLDPNGERIASQCTFHRSITPPGFDRSGNIHYAPAPTESSLIRERRRTQDERLRDAASVSLFDGYKIQEERLSGASTNLPVSQSLLDGYKTQGERSRRNITMKPAPEISAEVMENPDPIGLELSEEEKSLFDTFVREMTDGKNAFELSRYTELNANKWPALEAKYADDMTEACLKYATGYSALRAQKALREKYFEEMVEAKKKYTEGRHTLNASNWLTLDSKYREDMIETSKRYQIALSAQGASLENFDPVTESSGPFKMTPQVDALRSGGFAANKAYAQMAQELQLFPSKRDHSTPPSFYSQQLQILKEILEAASVQTGSLITKALGQQECEQSALKSPEAYTQPFCDFLTENPTVWHAVQYFETKLQAAGFKKLFERQTWNSTLEKGGKYYTTRNGSSLIAFTVGSKYKSGNGVAMIAGHVDALTARLKPVSSKTTKAGYVQLGVAPYAGALNSTWWDRDLGIGGRVLVKDGKTGKIETKLVKLGWPIARIPTLAPHFGVGMTGSNNTETEAVPIIGLDNTSSSSTTEFENLTIGGAGSFAATQPPKLVRAIAGELSIRDYSSIINWELELYDTQPAQVGGLEKEFIFAGRIDDKLCSWSAIEALLASSSSSNTTGGESDDGIIKLVGVFDDEEIGSLLRQGARGNFLPSTIERIAESFAESSSANVLSQTYANSFLISADVTHAVNPNFLARYLENHAPRLNVGLVVSADSNGHMTTDSVSTALLTRIAEKSDSELQLFMIRNDSRSGGTVGPMLSSAMGVRAIDAGIPQLSMHSIRATTGSLDPGLGVKIFAGFFEHFQGVDAEFE